MRGLRTLTPPCFNHVVWLFKNRHMEADLIVYHDLDHAKAADGLELNHCLRTREQDVVCNWHSTKIDNRCPFLL